MAHFVKTSLVLGLALFVVGTIPGVGANHDNASRSYVATAGVASGSAAGISFGGGNSGSDGHVNATAMVVDDINGDNVQVRICQDISANGHCGEAG